MSLSSEQTAQALSHALTDALPNALAHTVLSASLGKHSQYQTGHIHVS